MQTFDQKLHPNLIRLDNIVSDMLSQPEAKDWDSPRRQYEICRIHPVYFMEEYGRIRPDKVELSALDEGNTTGTVRFKLNPSQLIVADRVCAHFTGPKFTRVQMLVLKHRKVGVSTLFAAFDYWHIRFYKMMNAFVIADLGGHTDNIVDMIDTFHKYDTCGRGAADQRFRPITRVPMMKNKKGLRFSNGSMVEQDTGENSNPGTSGTVNVVHMSENSKWRDPENAETSLLNSVPRTGYACIFKESTAFGVNKFARDCEEAEEGKSSWEMVFLSWLDMPDCEDEVYEGEDITLDQDEKELMAQYKPKMRLGHIKFRRRQIELLHDAERFKQDFPLNSREPFLVSGANYFNVVEVQRRINEIKFYKAWKKNGLVGLDERYPDVIARIRSHERGERAALAQMEENCVVAQHVNLTENDGEVSYLRCDARPSDSSVEVYRYPQMSRKYLVSVDVAEGKMSSNLSVVEVFDAYTKEQVAEWCGVFDEEITAMYAVWLAKMYGSAVIVPEMNNKCGGTLWEKLKDTGYNNLFYTETVKDSKRRKAEGWTTLPGMKHDVYSQFRLDFKNGICLIHSLKLLEEMLYFMDVQGKLGAADNHTDDCVSATAINIKVITITPSLRNRKDSLPAYAPTSVGNRPVYVDRPDPRRYL